MSRRLSRREMANYAIAQLLKGVSIKPLARKLAAALIESGRAKESDLLISDISSELESRGKLAQVEISSANALDKQLVKSLVELAKDRTDSAEALVKSRVEPNLIGGFRLETATKVWDKTIKRRLSDIKGGIDV